MKRSFEEKEILTVKQLAEYLQMDEHTIYRLARAKIIPGVKIKGQWRFKKNLIDKWLEDESLKSLQKDKKEKENEW